ncbi:transcriptional regulatory protein DegU [Cytophagales bacterium WSM2-2]|nr:transcriptional regulatory protein DegU [Cytophagales bacterium WSM2-2]
MKKISVGIADDHLLFCEGIRMIIAEMPNITLDLIVASGEELLEALTNVASIPDVILLDIKMKGMNGIDVLKNIRKLKPEIKVIMLSMSTEPVMIRHALKNEANSFLKKECEKSELQQAILSVSEKGFYVNDDISRALLLGITGAASKKPASFDLTDREKEVLSLICQEYTTQEIGEKLFISERTVEGYRKSLCTKLNKKNTAGLVKAAILENLVEF